MGKPMFIFFSKITYDTINNKKSTLTYDAV